MDESSTRMRANMEKVLRAMDVIPPFRHGDRQSTRGAGSPGYASSQPQAERCHGSPSQTPSTAAPDEGENRSKSDAAIPEFDLGERILAEQRRMTARKRRAPGASDTEPSDRVRETGTAPRTLLAAPSADDLLQLQRIVADIISRDIERLCAGSRKTPY